MCTWFYADYKPLSTFIDKAQHLPLAGIIDTTNRTTGARF